MVKSGTNSNSKILADKQYSDIPITVCTYSADFPASVSLCAAWGVETVTDCGVQERKWHAGISTQRH